MLLPGSKGWINKYFHLLKVKGFVVNTSCPPTYSVAQYLHILSGKTGILCGHYTQFLFFSLPDSKKWTFDEKIKVLFFEFLLWIYINKSKEKIDFSDIDSLKQQFIDSLYLFYTHKKNTTFIRLKKTETKTSQIETILSKRIDSSQRMFDNQWWFKTKTNLFTYLDIILYYRFMEHPTPKTAFTQSKYADYVYNTLVAIGHMIHSDKTIIEQKKHLFYTFFSQANFEKKEREKILQLIDKGFSNSDFSPSVLQNELLSRYIFDMALLSCYQDNEEISQQTENRIGQLAHFIGLNSNEIELSMAMLENLMLEGNTHNRFFIKKLFYQKIQTNLSDRWTKIILRNKDKLIVELDQSKELVLLIKKSMIQELDEREKEKVRHQFLDIVRAMPMLAIFMLPGGAILLPLILKLLPDLIPSAFQDNKIEDDEINT